jgi:hypothetical protein
MSDLWQVCLARFLIISDEAATGSSQYGIHARETRDQNTPDS